MITVKYFARLGEALKSKEESIQLEGQCDTIANLLDLLRSRGEPWASELSTQNKVLMALNHEMCDEWAELKAGDEVGFFPPVTGG